MANRAGRLACPSRHAALGLCQSPVPKNQATTMLLTLLPHRPGATHPNPMGPVDPVPEPLPGNPLPPEPVGPHPTPEPV